MQTAHTWKADRQQSLRGHTVPTALLIAGEWIERDKSFTVTNPATNEEIARVSDGTAEDALRALEAATASQEAWAAWAPRQRANLFHRAHRLMLERATAFAEIMTLESGKPLAEAKAEFALSADFFLWYAEQIAHLHGTFASGSPGGYRIIATHRPVGPCFLVTPWNFPLLMIARKGGAALAAGCTTIVKSARETPLTAALFAQTLLEAGFPAGTVNLIHTTSSASISEALLADPRLRKVSFTGSTEVGSRLLSGAAQNIINASMELGGDGPFVVLEDADIDLAVRQGIVCKFRNAGQACVAANRIICHAAVVDEFTQKFVDETRKLRVGDGFEPGTDVGPIISPSQLDRVDRMVAMLKDAGAELLTGGKRKGVTGNFYEPTVMRIKGSAPACRNEELFAPIAVIYSVDSVAEAIRFANDTIYGLAAYVFTRNVDRAIAVSEKLDFGMVGINRGIMADPAAPFGGIKSSGLGREAGHDGIYEFLEPQYLALTVNEAAGISQ